MNADKIANILFATLFMFVSYIGLAAIEQTIAEARPAFEAVVVLCVMFSVGASVMALDCVVKAFKE